MSGLHPALVLFSAALLVGLTRGRLRQFVLVAGTLLALLSVYRLVPDASWSYELSSYQLQLLRVDPLSKLFGLIFCLIAAIGTVYALHAPRGGEHAATLVYAGGALGVVFAGDWITAFVLWELMGMASVLVVWYGGTQRAGAAGLRYLFVHILGGSLFFAGVVVHLARGGGVSLEPLGAAATDGIGLAYALILSGVAINAAIPPLHAWLTDAYPEASVTGTVFLSAFTTKTAVYLLIRAFPGAEILVWGGVIMALYGVVFAVLENDIRRLLAYHIVSQVGYMVAAVGIGTAGALNGAAAHAFCHVLYKALLLMGAGAALQATGKRKLTELGGIGASMPLVFVLYTVGAFSISGVPLFSGFISKSMIVSAAAESGRPVVEMLLMLATVGTFLHTGLKLPYFTFFGPNRGLKPAPVPRNMLVGMGVAALLCLGLGLFPGWLYARLATQPVDYDPYSADHVVSALQLLMGTGVGFWLLLGRLGGEPTVSLDADWLYRKPLPMAMGRLVSVARRTGSSLQASGLHLIARAGRYFENPFLVLGGKPTDPAALAYDEDRYRQPIGLTILWVVVFLALLALIAW